MRANIAAIMLIATVTHASAESSTSRSQNNDAPFEVHTQVDNGASIVEFGTKRTREETSPFNSSLYFKFYGFIGEEQSWLRFGEKSGLGVKVGSKLSFDITRYLRAQTSVEVWAVPSVATFLQKPATRVNFLLTYTPEPNLLFSIDYSATQGDQINPLSTQWTNTVRVRATRRFNF